MGRVRSHLRSNVVGYVALFVALSGTAWAATEIERNEVASKHIRNAGVKEKDLANGAVTSPKVRDATLRSADRRASRALGASRGRPVPPGATGSSTRLAAAPLRQV